ncbi:MAG: BREX-1 system adenine-specific DNA-methyltransferase PglX [Marinobacter sp.]|jgi:hypothetical protein|uniref:BREX-1 system adenine-specific DNA-methyltransferase PglX n=1 Tax=Alcanivorax jadensis TaxID=64988 RepID=UPI0023521EA1|nr:BREX-1 system adenine-specific DNA-methyltransferase PglX [Alcanivorax jadensis]|tara:strand:+ start:7843 stop:11439 length:3597 start_codon:yes stop_codon:yes gene_type:complete
MNKSALKKYAPQARLDFIAAVTRRAEQLGLNPQSPAKVEKQGEAMLINGQAFPAAYGRMRTTLEARIREQGFTQVMEAMAYTWFNRLVAIRYMELHGFLDHGYQVLSHPANKDTGHTQPEILDHIPELDLPGFDKEQALELKLAGNKDEELYREVLLAQCHALHQAMPFLFESLDDATELLLPDGLLRTDSILGKLVTAIDEADWQDVEIIGWLYQFYISEKKDQVIGKVVKSEDIPAATQLFTPNWIVKYLVQNSLGRLWLMANPTSNLATKWEYYIQPAEQTPEVNAQLDALIQARITEDGATLNPESLTLLDPACGSGHILVEAYDLLRDIYLERGYRRQDIPRLILEKNLYGLDIDDRAAQLAGFALLMKARADDRRLFGQPVALNVLALQEAKEGSAAELHSTLNAPQIDYATVSQLVETFAQAKTFGSLIQITNELASALPDLQRELEAVSKGGDMLGRDAAETLLRLVAQAEVLAKQFDAVVANPPYMGGKGMNADLKAWAKKTFPASKSDLFAMFIERGFGWCKPAGFNSMVTMQSWMFLSSFEGMRTKLLEDRTLSCMVHMGNGVMGIAFGTAATVLMNRHIDGFDGSFSYCENDDLNDAGIPAQFPVPNERLKTAKPDDFKKIPGSPVAYWASKKVFECFSNNKSLGEFANPNQALVTGNTDRYIRCWWEPSSARIGFGHDSRESAAQSGRKWFPYHKGGPYRNWFGNTWFVVNWEDDGHALRTTKHPTSDRIWAHNFVLDSIFKESLVWAKITSGEIGFRYSPKGFLFDDASGVCPPTSDEPIQSILAFLISPVAKLFSGILSPTLNMQPGDLASIPYVPGIPKVYQLANELIELAWLDWDAREDSYGFLRPSIPKVIGANDLIRHSFDSSSIESSERVRTYSDFQEELNKLIADAYGVSDEVDLDVKSDQVTLTVNPTHRFGEGGSGELAAKEQSDYALGIVSYAVGCMMGRYSLDAPGLIYAHAANEGFDPSRYETFPADDDGIVPITDEAWFDDDGTNRIREFVRVVWGKDTEAENMSWLAESLGSKASESADDTIRRYLSRDFYKDHLKTYKKRPIYWLFSSGKNKAFEALVYLHRYNAGTLSRMRMEYVVPLQSRMQARIDNLDQDIQSSTSSTEQKRFQKQKDKLIKQLDELRRFDENLRHYADQRITLDLDDGVKVNYGKFGDLLAEVKAITGRSPSKID